MTANDVQRFYRLQSLFYDETRWLFLHGRKQAVAAMELQPGSRVLEVGCGTGLNFRHIVRHLGPSRGVLVGLDFSGAMLRRARRRVSAAGWPHVQLVCGDAGEAAFPHGFDAILFSYSLSMIPAWREAISRARDNLRPGGRLVVLDFGQFDGWGPLRSPILAWLRMNHVEAARPWVEHIRERFPSTQVRSWLGGYARTVVATR